jgi:hypothetical protein
MVLEVKRSPLGCSGLYGSSDKTIGSLGLGKPEDAIGVDIGLRIATAQPYRDS